MKLSLSLLLSGLSYGAFASAISSGIAKVYFHDQDSVAEPATEPPTLLADTARLIFAQRLGLSSFHSLQDVNEDALRHVNQYSIPQHRLFGDYSSTKRSQAVVIVEDEERPEDIDPSLTSLPSFHISNPPSPSSNAALLQDLIDQARSNDYGLTPSSNFVRYLEHDGSSKNLPDSDRYFLHRKSSQNIAELLSTLRTKSTSVTLVFMPTSNASNANSWGSYSLPSESYVHSPHAHAHIKRQGDELLNAEAEDSKVGENIETVSASALASSTSSGSISSPTSTAPVAGILPACFSNQAACNDTTDFCSGHGSCTLKYTIQEDPEGSKSECWACACQNTVDKNDLGTKTTVWGGPACQKKDVSTGFWLLAGFSIAMVSAVSWGIGLLVSMGSEELPSVIGAGVSGPGARGK